MEIHVLIPRLKLLLVMHILVFHYASSSPSPSPSSSSSKTNNNTDRLALLAIKSKIELPSNSPILSSWNLNTASFCNWVGVSCDQRHHRVSALNMSYMNIHGTISPHIGNLSFLRYLNLGSNSFHGPIPKTIGRLRRLRVLNLRDNQLEGSIPSTISRTLTSLEDLVLQYNHFVGAIPSSVLNITTLRVVVLSFNRISGGIPNDFCRMLPHLEVVYLSSNPLGGQIPTSLCLCRNLKELELGGNGLSGSIPTQLGCLYEIEYLYINKNQLTGTIPASLGNLSKLEFIDLSVNNLSGKVPDLTSSLFPKLTELYFNGNRFSGRIPDFISNASILTILELSYNSFSGQVPMKLGSLQYLKYLNLELNELTNDPTQRKLHFLTCLTQCRQLKYLSITGNPLKGVLPTSIGNFSTSLEKFFAGETQIQGSLPYQIGNLSGLLMLQLHSNELIGAIPSSIRNLQKIQQLYLYDTKLEGNLPNEICQLISLGQLDLSRNKLSGLTPFCIGNLTNIAEISLASNAFTTIPETMWSLSNAWFMNFSDNSLVGYLASVIGKMVMLQTLDLSKNRLSASIPETLSNLRMLQILNLSGNAFQGNIPTSIGDLGSLESLDLSSNNLSGVIPKSLEELHYLKHLNLSFNILSGPIPAHGAFANFTIQSFMGNHDLCGNSKLKLPPCPKTTASKSKTTAIWLKYVLTSGVAVLLATLLLTLYIKSWRKSKNLSASATELSIKWGHKYISYYNLLNATNNLSEVNLLGSGSFGSVYKRTMPDGEIVAVKVFNLDVEGATTSFDRECAVLRNVRHRNLVKIISSCSNLDFRALILQYMPNGSLEKWLYSQGQNCLNILKRMDIMIDVASGLDYLHNGYSEPVVHCDVKPSNVLLDEDMVAHVGDFGIAKMLANYKSMTQTETLGTVGYIAPELGLQGRISPKIDVYSYGILLMETFTRKSPRDEMFAGGLSLRQWVNSSCADRVMDILDTGLWTGQEEATMAVVDSLTSCLSSIFVLALQCSSELPKERVDMTDIVIKLKKIKQDMMQHPSRFRRR